MGGGSETTTFGGLGNKDWSGWFVRWFLIRRFKHGFYFPASFWDEHLGASTRSIEKVLRAIDETAWPSWRLQI
jgi:hypothetical protein